jgi:hypothetical protein
MIPFHRTGAKLRCNVPERWMKSLNASFASRRFSTRSQRPRREAIPLGLGTLTREALRTPPAWLSASQPNILSQPNTIRQKLGNEK